MLYGARHYFKIKAGKTLPSLEKDLPTLENAHQPIPIKKPQIRHSAPSISMPPEVIGGRLFGGLRPCPLLLFWRTLYKAYFQIKFPASSYRNIKFLAEMRRNYKLMAPKYTLRGS